jgi:imidazolonepropionase-like amidohydrolase
MGFDSVAHLVVRGTPGSPDVNDTIAFLKARGIVMDPTISWNELLGRSAETPVASFLPGIGHVAPALRRLIESANGGSVTPEQAQDRLANSLAIIKALHDAKVPIVAGTDKGVPGVSLEREIELYVQAGFPPMDAIRAATAACPTRRSAVHRPSASPSRDSKRAATAVPATVMGLDKDSGTVAAGLRADLIIVDGNPLTRISDLRNVAFVCANGRLFEIASLWAAGSFKP